MYLNGEIRKVTKILFSFVSLQIFYLHGGLSPSLDTQDSIAKNPYFFSKWRPAPYLIYLCVCLFISPYTYICTYIRTYRDRYIDIDIWLISDGLILSPQTCLPENLQVCSTCDLVWYLSYRFKAFTLAPHQPCKVSSTLSFYCQQ